LIINNNKYIFIYSPNVAQPTSAELPPTPVIRKEKPLESSEIVIFDFPPTVNIFISLLKRK